MNLNKKNHILSFRMILQKEKEKKKNLYKLVPFLLSLKPVWDHNEIRLKNIKWLKFKKYVRQMVLYCDHSL